MEERVKSSEEQAPGPIQQHSKPDLGKKKVRTENMIENSSLEFTEKFQVVAQTWTGWAELCLQLPSSASRACEFRIHLRDIRMK
jgi:hypothetical protein